MAGSLNSLDVSAPTQELMFMLASNVNVSNYVTVKLSSQSNYHIWKAQMICLIESQMLRGIIDTGFRLPEGIDSNMIKRYDTLIKGWIFGSVDERLLENLVKYESARQLLKVLESYYNTQINSATEVPSPGFSFRGKSVSTPEIEGAEDNEMKKKLYEATVKGRWRKAKWILKIDEDAATMAISENGNTMLHLAIEMGHNYFVKQLLMFLKNGADVEKRNTDGRTALHTAAMVNNPYAARLLVQKRKQLLSILDHKAHSPLDIAYNNLKLKTYVYLLGFAPPSYDLSHYPDAYTKNAVKLIVTSINRKQYDISLILLQKYPELALKSDQILMTMATTFPTDLGSIESFIYPSLNNVCQKILVRGSLLLDYFISWVEVWQKTNYLAKILMTLHATFYSLYELICLLILVLLRFPVSVFYFLMWKALAVTFLPCKNIEKKKKERKEAREILSLICDQMGTSTSCYNGPILEAVRQDVYEVVDEILYHAPDKINCQDEEGHNVIQLAIINRAEKVCNLIHHIIEHTESYRTMKDSSMNNLAHLAASLAPSFVLDRHNGAALQLRHELLWREEVENLLSPVALNEHNINMETPRMVFDREHAGLKEQAENWAKTTAASSSITAAINVTIAFAAAITVPGGSNQESGIPLFNKELAFSMFAVFNTISLFTSATALLLFVSVFTTGFSENVFWFSLPQRLILGLILSSMSTVSMFESFIAIFFLVFRHIGPWMVTTLAFAFLPISVFYTIELPSTLALMRSTYVPIFGKKRYINHCKINRKNTIFFC